MIEVNLIPGGKKRRGGGLGIPMPDFSKIPLDPFSLGAGVASVSAIGVLVWMFLGRSVRYGSGADAPVMREQCQAVTFWVDPSALITVKARARITWRISLLSGYKSNNNSWIRFSSVNSVV